MSHYEVVTALANGDWENVSRDSDNDSPVLFSQLNEARLDLQDDLESLREAVREGNISDGYSVRDFAIREIATGRIIPVAWDVTETNLLLRVSMRTLVENLAAVLADDVTPERRAFLAEFANTALQHGIDDRSHDAFIVLPSHDGPRYDKHAIAPTGLSRGEAVDYVNTVTARANRLDAEHEYGGIDEEGTPVGEYIEQALEEAGFTILSDDNGNLGVAEAWDAPAPAESEAESVRP